MSNKVGVEHQPDKYDDSMVQPESWLKFVKPWNHYNDPLPQFRKKTAALFLCFSCWWPSSFHLDWWAKNGQWAFERSKTRTFLGAQENKDDLEAWQKETPLILIILLSCWVECILRWRVLKLRSRPLNYHLTWWLPPTPRKLTCPQKRHRPFQKDISSSNHWL